MPNQPTNPNQRATYIVRRYPDGLTRGEHLMADVNGLQRYIEWCEDERLIFATEVVAAMPCVNVLTCDHQVVHGWPL